MASIQMNDLPDNKMPTEVAVGRVAYGIEPEDLAGSLIEGGIDAGDIFFLHGEGGLAQIKARNPITRFFDETTDDVTKSLREGALLIGIYGVDSDHADKVRALLVDNGVVETHYFGRWTVE